MFCFQIRILSVVSKGHQQARLSIATFHVSLVPSLQVQRLGQLQAHAEQNCQRGIGQLQQAARSPAGSGRVGGSSCVYIYIYIFTYICMYKYIYI